MRGDADHWMRPHAQRGGNREKEREREREAPASIRYTAVGSNIFRRVRDDEKKRGWKVMDVGTDGSGIRLVTPWLIRRRSGH